MWGPVPHPSCLITGTPEPHCQGRAAWLTARAESLPRLSVHGQNPGSEESAHCIRVQRAPGPWLHYFKGAKVTSRVGGDDSRSHCESGALPRTFPPAEGLSPTPVITGPLRPEPGASPLPAPQHVCWDREPTATVEGISEGEQRLPSTACKRQLLERGRPERRQGRAPTQPLLRDRLTHSTIMGSALESEQTQRAGLAPWTPLRPSQGC